MEENWPLCKQPGMQRNVAFVIKSIARRFQRNILGSKGVHAFMRLCCYYEHCETCDQHCETAHQFILVLFPYVYDFIGPQSRHLSSQSDSGYDL